MELFFTISIDCRLLQVLIAANSSFVCFEASVVNKVESIIVNVESLVGNVGVVEVFLLGHLPGAKNETLIYGGDQMVAWWSYLLP